MSPSIESAMHGRALLSSPIMNQAQSVSCRASRVVVVAPRYSRTLKIAISARGASQIELAGRAGQHAALPAALLQLPSRRRRLGAASPRPGALPSTQATAVLSSPALLVSCRPCFVTRCRTR